MKEIGEQMAFDIFLQVDEPAELAGLDDRDRCEVGYLNAMPLATGHAEASPTRQRATTLCAQTIELPRA